MGTRATYGLRKYGKDKLTYNHFDGYPTGLGDAIVKQIMEMGIDRLNRLFDNLEMVEEGVNDTNYTRLREIQGDLLGHERVGQMIDNNDFINDSLFCEWGYIVNLDTLMLEVYKGFQRKKHKKGRYATDKPAYIPNYDPSVKYFPCALVLEIPLLELDTCIMGELEELVEISDNITLDITKFKFHGKSAHGGKKPKTKAKPKPQVKIGSASIRLDTFIKTIDREERLLK